MHIGSDSHRSGKRRSWALRSSVLVLVLGTVWMAQAKAAVDCANPRMASGTLGAATYDAVRRASELIAQKKSDEAITKLSAFVNRGQDFDKATIQYNLGVAYSEKQDYKSAAEAFAKAISYNTLPQNQTEQLQFSLGQLYIAAGDSAKGIETLRQYIAEACSPVTPEAHMFLASALADQKRYEEALPEVEIALSKSKAPKESWLQFKLGVQYEMKQYKSAAETLLTLIALMPNKPEYWKQLSGVMLEMDNQTDALAVMALAERQGFMEKPADIMNLYNIYMLIDIPLKAGMLVEDALAQGRLPEDEKTLEAVANAWLNARETEKAEAALKKVASVADKGEYYFRLGAMYGDKERWKESKEMLQLAVSKGGLKRPGDAYFRIALAEYRMDNLPGAIAALQKAQGFEETKRQAGEWMQSLQAEFAARQTQQAHNAQPAGVEG